MKNNNKGRSKNKKSFTKGVLSGVLLVIIVYLGLLLVDKVFDTSILQTITFSNFSMSRQQQQPVIRPTRQPAIQPVGTMGFQGGEGFQNVYDDRIGNSLLGKNDRMVEDYMQNSFGNSSNEKTFWNKQKSKEYYDMKQGLMEAFLPNLNNSLNSMENSNGENNFSSNLNINPNNNFLNSNINNFDKLQNNRIEMGNQNSSINGMNGMNNSNGNKNKMNSLNGMNSMNSNTGMYSGLNANAVMSMNAGNQMKNTNMNAPVNSMNMAPNGNGNAMNGMNGMNSSNSMNAMNVSGAMNSAMDFLGGANAMNSNNANNAMNAMNAVNSNGMNVVGNKKVANRPDLLRAVFANTMNFEQNARNMNELQKVYNEVQNASPNRKNKLMKEAGVRLENMELEMSNEQGYGSKVYNWMKSTGRTGSIPANVDLDGGNEKYYDMSRLGNVNQDYGVSGIGANNDTFARFNNPSVNSQEPSNSNSNGFRGLQEASNAFARNLPTGLDKYQGKTDFLISKHHIGVNTIGNSLKNSTKDIRGEPQVSAVAVSPWNQSTIERDNYRQGVSIGGI